MPCSVSTSNQQGFHSIKISSQQHKILNFCHEYFAYFAFFGPSLDEAPVTKELKGRVTTAKLQIKNTHAQWLYFLVCAICWHLFREKHIYISCINCIDYTFHWLCRAQSDGSPTVRTQHRCSETTVNLKLTLVQGRLGLNSKLPIKPTSPNGNLVPLHFEPSPRLSVSCGDLL